LVSDGDGDGEGYNLTLGVHILVLGEQNKDIEGSLKVFAHWAGRAGMKHWPVSVWKFLPPETERSGLVKVRLEDGSG
jgi:hypothetical protein